MQLENNFFVDRNKKQNLLKQKGVVIWISGLSGSGKSTLANNVEKKLFELGLLTEVLDGDEIRLGLNKNLSFSLEERMENIRRAAETAKLFKNCGIITLCCFVSPLNSMRNLAKEIVGEDDFIEVFLSTSIKCCENRDVKGLYEKAREGKIKDFTGIDSPFEIPELPDLTIDTENTTIEESVEILTQKIRNKIFIKDVSI